ncbi:MAG: PIN domain-containing protein [Chloroflexota bacterium]|nr:PIN domain-containing protein [Chloroflexota bacterium]
MARFLDTNILIRYLTGDDPDKASLALALLDRVADGMEQVVTTPLVIFETIFLMQRTYKLAKTDIREKITAILAVQGLRLAERALCLGALDHYVEQNISYADAYNAAWMREQGIAEVYSWDREYDRVAGLKRIEPV